MIVKGVIVNTMLTYNKFQERLQDEITNYQYYEAFEDEYGMKQSRKKIERINKELGQFLNEVV